MAVRRLVYGSFKDIRYYCMFDLLLLRPFVEVPTPCTGRPFTRFGFILDRAFGAFAPADSSAASAMARDIDVADLFEDDVDEKALCERAFLRRCLPEKLTPACRFAGYGWQPNSMRKITTT